MCTLKLGFLLDREMCLSCVSVFAEVPAVVVGVVGMGHVPGIEKNWEKQLNIQEIMRSVFVKKQKINRRQIIRRNDV